MPQTKETKKVLFSHNTDEWYTPQDLYDELDAEFHFTLDPCATVENHKAPLFYTKEQNGLSKDWGGQSVFVNPPYSDNYAWVRKCYYEGCKPNTTVVLLIPSRTDTKYFHNYIYHRAEVRFISGRLKYGGAKYNAPFPSMLVIFRGCVEQEK